MSVNQDQQDLIDFSREVADYILQFMEVYPSLFSTVAYLMTVESSPSVEAELMEVRTAAGNMAGVMTLFSRTIDSSVDTYSRFQVDAQYHPLPVRSLVQDMAESCVLISRVMSLGDLSGLPLITPAELGEKLEKPQIAAWMQVNQPPLSEQSWRNPEQPAPGDTQTYAGQHAGVDTSAYPEEQPSSPASYPPASPAESPYPPTDPTDPGGPVSPPPEIQPPEIQPPAPPAPDEPWRAPGPPGGLPGDRSR